jgi:hypothetical protein
MRLPAPIRKIKKCRILHACFVTGLAFPFLKQKSDQNKKSVSRCSQREKQFLDTADWFQFGTVPEK